MALVGLLSAEPQAPADRRERRHELQLHVQATAANRSASAVVHNLSSSGLLIEAAGSLAMGDVIDVIIPEAGHAQAEVVWHSGNFYGCEFVAPLSKAALSAAVLVAPPRVQRAESIEPPAVQRAAANPAAMAPAVKLAIITGLALACWGVVLGALALVVL